MFNSILPTTVGATPIKSTGGSQLVFGRDTSVTFEAIGLGEKGRPNILQKIIINLSTSTDKINYVKTASIVLDPAAILSLIQSNVNVPKPLNMTLKEVSVCERDNVGVSSEKRMVIIGSDTYYPTT